MKPNEQRALQPQAPQKYAKAQKLEVLRASYSLIQQQLEDLYIAAVSDQDFELANSISNTHLYFKRLTFMPTDLVQLWLHIEIMRMDVNFETLSYVANRTFGKNSAVYEYVVACIELLDSAQSAEIPESLVDSIDLRQPISSAGIDILSAVEGSTDLPIRIQMLPELRRDARIAANRLPDLDDMRDDLNAEVFQEELKAGIEVVIPSWFFHLILQLFSRKESKEITKDWVEQTVNNLAPLYGYILNAKNGFGYSESTIKILFIESCIHLINSIDDYYRNLADFVGEKSREVGLTDASSNIFARLPYPAQKLAMQFLTIKRLLLTQS